MGARVGVLLDGGVLEKALRKEPVFERVDLYAAAARELGIEVVLFNIWAIDFDKKLVDGYVSRGQAKFTEARVPLPKVIHNRALLNRDADAMRRLRKLHRSVHVFNPIIDHDKLSIHRLLYRDRKLRPHLPETVSLSRDRFDWLRRRLRRHGEVFIKPRRGSLGNGIARVSRRSRGLYRYEFRRTKFVGSFRRTWRWVRYNRRRGYLLQAGIPLPTIDGYRYDLRVPVQRDHTGVWQVPGMAAKRSDGHPFLTNIARGGTALSVHEALRGSLEGVRPDEVIISVAELALRVAKTLSKRYPTLADLGLDIGLDRKGTPFLIEVNRRDLRIIFPQAGETALHARLYRNPLAYALYLLQSQ